MAVLLKGNPVAQAINDKSAKKLEKLSLIGILPTLAIVRVGSREDDIAYENSVVSRCDKVGVKHLKIILPGDVSQSELENLIKRLNVDSSVHGILIFMPLPVHLDREAVQNAILPEKDVDGISPGSLAGVLMGRGKGFPPCTPAACIELLDYYGIDCKGRRAVVIGRSLTVGKPLAMLLMNKNATVTVCHTKTINLPTITKDAEILIAAAGSANMLGGEHLSPGQCVIDVGINFTDGKMCGDVDFSTAESMVSSITPVPGGVGTVTSSVLVNHVVEAAARQSTK